MADMKREFEKLGGDFYQAFSDFIKVFSLKRVATMLIVGLTLFLVCSPQDVPVQTDNQPLDCGNACPMPKVINVPTIVITEVRQENWQFDLMDDGWKDAEPSTLNAKSVKINEEKGCKLFLLKESTNDSLSKHAVETLRGFTEHSIYVDSVKIAIINGNKYIASLLADDLSTIWIYMTVKDSFGYTFVCGCDDNKTGSEVCPGTAGSLQIK